MIVITGASDGLGLQLAKLYSKSGKKVVNISRRNCEYASTNILADLREGSEIARAAREVSSIEEPLEAIINCAGVVSVQSFGEITEDEIKRLMSTNLKSAMLLVSELIERAKQDGADILNVSSTYGQKGSADQAVYAASKWAMRGFTASLQQAMKDTPCRVVSFCPGGFTSKLFEKATGIDNTQDKNEWMQPEDLALLIKQILDMPKNIEVTEIVINRKKVKA